MNEEFLTPKSYAYHYDLEKIKEYVIKNWGIWEMDEPPTGLVVYLAGTEVHIGNDYPYIEFKGDIEIARKIHHIGKALKRNIELEEENEILKIIKDNFDLWIEPNYRATLQFQQNTSLTQGDYEKLIKYFGEPRDD